MNSKSLINQIYIIIGSRFYINGRNEGFLLLSTKMSELKKAYQQIWWILTISFGLAFVIILFLGSKITNRYTKPIERATNVAFELAKGNYRARTYEDQLEETRDVKFLD